MEYAMVPRVSNRMVQQLGGEKPRTDAFASEDVPQQRNNEALARGGLCVSKHCRLKDWGTMYWYGAQEDIKRTVNKIIADRVKGILVVTGVGCSPCPLEDLKPTFNSITLDEIRF